VSLVGLRGERQIYGKNAESASVFVRLMAKATITIPAQKAVQMKRKFLREFLRKAFAK
jgi:hypothetical protein